MGNTARALVPVKPLSLSKLRLAELLTPAERAELTLAMMEDVLTNLNASDAIRDIVVVTRDPVVAERARRRSVGLILEPEPATATEASLNAALSFAVRKMQPTPALLVVPADVPVVEAAEYTAVVEAWAGGVLAVSAQDGGTNGLLSRVDDDMTYHFGPDSLEVHREVALGKGLEFATTTTANWARDIDEPEDIAWLAQQSDRFASVQFAKQVLRCKAQLRRSA